MQLLMGNANPIPIPNTKWRATMTKVNPTTQDNDALRARPAEVQPPQHQHTDDIEFRAVGESEDRRRFLKVAKGEKTALLDVDNIADPRSGELKKLTPLGASLIKPAARTEFLARAHDAARQQPTFLVALKTGFYEGEFVLPPGLDPQGPANVERYFDQRYDQYHRRLHPAGTIRGWLQLADLCRGKTRLIAGLCLSVSGPVCAVFGYEAPGLQAVSPGGFAKTTIGRIVGTPWGGNEKLTGKLGCGVSWNQTNLNLEIVAAAFNEMFLFLDDMHRAKKEDVEKIIEIMNGEGRGRWTETQHASFIVPVFSTSNTSGVAFARHFKMLDQLEALIDRLSDIPRPDGCPYMVEGIRTSGELREYGNKVRDLSRQNFGLAGPEFERRLTQEVKSDRASAQAFVDARQRTYWDAANDLKSLAGRDLTRISDKFATAYITGCLAARYKIFPYTEAEMLEALWTCQRDHLAFVDQELGHAPARAISFVGASTAVAQPPALAGAVTPAATPFDRLRRFIDRNIIPQRGERDQLSVPLRNGQLTFVYLREHHGQEEYWFPGDLFAEIAGDSREALALKKELFGRGLLVTTRRGRNLSYVIKRPLPSGTRPFFVVIRHYPQKSPARGQALAAAMTV
jgi:Domain of unknown function (DUF927)